MARTIILKCSGDEVLEVDELVAMESQTIKEMIEGGSAENGIAFTEFTANILSKAMEYCKKHVDAAAANEDLSSWDAEFVNVDQATIFDLILAAKKLKIQGLLDFTCQTVADMIKGKTPEEIRRIFNLKNEFTPEEEEEIRRESQWAFE